jgi:hypothetical protein
MKEQDYLDAVNDDLGYCTNCREFTNDGCEPDALHGLRQSEE